MFQNDKSIYWTFQVFSKQKKKTEIPESLLCIEKKNYSQLNNAKVSWIEKSNV